MARSELQPRAMRADQPRLEAGAGRHARPLWAGMLAAQTMRRQGAPEPRPARAASSGSGNLAIEGAPMRRYDLIFPCLDGL